jgi:hypothetical protein
MNAREELHGARRPIDRGSLPGSGPASVSHEAGGHVECAAADLDLVGATIAVWQPRTARELSREDARQVVENITGFFAILAEWSRAETLAPAKDSGKPAKTTTSSGGCGMTAETIVKAPDGRKAGAGWERFRP